METLGVRRKHQDGKVVPALNYKILELPLGPDAKRPVSQRGARKILRSNGYLMFVMINVNIRLQGQVGLMMQRLSRAPLEE